MQKQDAIQILGGSVTSAAEAIGITFQAVNQWPDVLPPRIADRVYAALARKAETLETFTRSDGSVVTDQRKTVRRAIDAGGAA